MSVEILYQDEGLIFVNKAFDMYINSDDANEKNTVANHIASPDSHLSSSSNPIHFVQRLDFSTSGVLCVCRHKEIAGDTGRLFQNRLAKKYYLAVVRGWLTENCEIKYRIAEDPSTSNTNHKMMALPSNDIRLEELKSRDAVTKIMPLKHGFYRNDMATTVLVKPTTGRRHQIRVHCSTIGHTILGDYTYSDRQDTIPHRMFLHAIRLVLPFKNRCLDIYTEDVFSNDLNFSQHWKSHEVIHPYRHKEEIIDLCNIIDVCQINKEYY